MRVAILEDDRSQAFVLRHCLTGAGHTPSVFNSGQSLLDALRSETFDLLLLDWNMPDITGVEVLNHVRKTLQLDVPAVIITARHHEKDVVLALAQGANDYICKPVRPRELLARVAGLTRNDNAQGKVLDDSRTDMTSCEDSSNGRTVAPRLKIY